MEYPEVKRSHIVPRCFLKNFAVEEKTTIHVIPTGREHTVSIDDAAVRRTFYRRHRPNGIPIDDYEWSLAQLEDTVAPLLQAVEHNWPLTGMSKGMLAEFFAYQAVRGPRWKMWHDEHTRREMERKRAERAHQMESGLWVPITSEDVDEVETRMLSDTMRLRRMSSVANKLITVFGSMKWDLIKFDEPLLVLSDHPITEWPLESVRRPAEVAAGHGIVNVLEVRVPVAPDLLLLMTWRPGRDGQFLSGDSHQAENANAFTIVQGEKQWMWRPGSEPAHRQSPGLFHPLSAEVCLSYHAEVAERSPVRARVIEELKSQVGEEPDLTQATIVTENRRAA